MLKIFFILLLMPLLDIASQNLPKIPLANYSTVDSIVIVGNEITDRDVITRELTFGVGDKISKHDLSYNTERIYSMGIFTNVNIVENKNIVTINVKEGWYIYPIPLFMLKDGDWKKISYGFDGQIKNFRGRNENVHAKALFGYENNFILSYSNPYLIWSESISFSMSMSYGSSKNESRYARYLYNGDFEQKNASVGFGFGKRFGLYHRAGISFGYNYIETPIYIKQVSASDDRIDNLYSIGTSYSYDTRDLAQFPREGILGVVNLDIKGMGIDNINYQVLSLDFREYRIIIDELGAKWRLSSRFAFGSLIPFYDYSSVGSNIRGYLGDKLEGDYSYFASLEFNYPVVRNFDISLDFIPIIPKQLLSYRVAMYLRAFGDTGTALLKNEPISFDKFHSGFGFGTTILILPYNIIRFDLAFNEQFKSEFIIDYGISF